MLLTATTIAIIAALMAIDYKNKKTRELYTHRAWLRLQEVDVYINNNINGHGLRQGISCLQCGTRSIRQHGVDSRHDPRRVHICNQCNSTLYRTYHSR